MKVLHIFNEIKFSGAELMYSDAASYMQENGIEMHALSSGKELGDFANNFKERNIKVVHKPYLHNFVISKTGIFFYFFLYQYIKKHRIDVIHIHRSTIYFAAVIGWLLKIPSVKTQHNVFVNRKFTRPLAVIRKKIIRKFFKTTFHTIGESVYNNELKQYKNPSVKINNWYNPNRFYPASNEEKLLARKKLNITEEQLVLISIGGCSTVKNHHDILKALASLKEKIPFTYLHLGKGKTECEEKELAKHLGIDNQCIFVGNTNKVRDYLIASDVYLMPSRFEGLSISLLEVMATGVPTILYNVPGLRDMINKKTQDNGFLIESNYEELANKIMEYYKSLSLRKEKSKNALNNVNQYFNMYKNVDRVINELYMLNKKKYEK